MTDIAVSVIIPTVRPQGAQRCLHALCARDTLITADPPTFLTPDGLCYEVLIEEDTARVGCPTMVHRMTRRSRGEMVCFLGDDTVPEPGMLTHAMAAMESFPDGWGLVALNDGIHEGQLATHWLAHKKLLPLVGEQFFSSAYHHNFCDKELTELAQDAGRYVYAPQAQIRHHHPLNGGEDDAIYAACRQTFRDDQFTYWRRKQMRTMGTKIAIGFPLVDEKIYSQFFLSFVCMEKPDSYTLLVPSMPHGAFPRSIEVARNSIVMQALDEGCTHLLICDTDQTYPPDTLAKLLAHDKDVVGVRVHRRWPPFDVIMLRGDIGHYTHVPDEECFSGDLVPIDATGTGCLLIKSAVFLDTGYPWFQETVNDQGKTVGEDIYFCSKVRGAGREIWVDTSIEVGHLTTHEIGRGIYQLYKAFNRVEWRS